MPTSLDTLGLTELIRLRDQISQVITRRFEKNLGLAFTDVVGSTSYLQQHGSEAGRTLLQRHTDLLNQVLPQVDGRLVDTAGDGAFTCYPRAEAAVQAMIRLQEAISADNMKHSREQQLRVRAGVHFGPVISDGSVVAGEPVHLCARLTGTSAAGEIRLSQTVFRELSSRLRSQCQGLPPVTLKDFARPVEVSVLQWRDRLRFPAAVRIEDTGVTVPLPDLDTIGFGRLRQKDGAPANDVVIELPDKVLTQRISRFHFELRRHPDAYYLRSLSEMTTEVDEKLVPKEAEVPLLPGSVVRLSGAVELTFLAHADDVEADGTFVGEAYSLKK